METTTEREGNRIRGRGEKGGDRLREFGDLRVA